MSNILKFVKKYEEKLKNDKSIKEEQQDRMYDYRDRISFYLLARASCPGIRGMSFSEGLGEVSITLDDEDLKILYEKYSKKLLPEMAARITEITKLYDRT